MIDRSAELDYAYDHLDDQGQYTAAEIWEQLGHKPEATNEDFSVDAIKERLGNVAVTKEVADPRQEWIESLHLTQPSSEGPIRHATPDELAVKSAQTNRIRNIVRSSRNEV